MESNGRNFQERKKKKVKRNCNLADIRESDVFIPDSMMSKRRRLEIRAKRIECKFFPFWFFS